MKSVLLRWTPSLNDRSKLKGECTDVKSGCITSVGPSLSPPQSQLKQNSRDTVPLSVKDSGKNSLTGVKTTFRLTDRLWPREKERQMERQTLQNVNGYL